MLGGDGRIEEVMGIPPLLLGLGGVATYAEA